MIQTNQLKQTIQQNQSCQFGDKEMLFDALTSEKHITDTYNTWVNESSTPEIRQQLIAILGEEHTMQNEIFTELSNRGWYKTKPADQMKVQQAKQKFSSQQS